MGELVTFGETPLRLSPPGKERVEMAGAFEAYADGTESTVAAAATALGTDGVWVSKVPDTAMGRNVVRQISSTGVKTDISWADNSRRQGLSFREFSTEPRQENRWEDRENAAISTVEPGELSIETIQEASIVFTALSTAVLSEQAASTTESVLSAGSGSGAVTAVELDYSRDLNSAAAYRDAFERVSDHVDLLVVPEGVVDEVLDESGKPREIANTLSAVYDLQIVVVRRDNGSGVALHDSPGTNVIHEREMIHTETVDPSGVGSAFTGGFLHELIQGSDASRALTTAVATAAFVETLPGPFLSRRAGEVETIAEQVVKNSQ